jgi:mannosyltransferase OCH1-like enzyme
MINRQIHQIFFDLGKGQIKDIPDFRESQRKTVRYCKENKIIYKLWTEQDCDDLIKSFEPHFQGLYHNFREPIQKIDFIRYVILYRFGGIYLDLDVHPLADITHLFEETYFFCRWHEGKLPYIAILGAEAGLGLYKDILDHCYESYKEKVKMPIYDKWVGRFVYQTTGHYMVQRVLKKHKIKHTDLLDIIAVWSKGKYVGKTSGNLFFDNNSSIWYDGKHYS